MLNLDVSINLSQNAHWPTSSTSASPMLATYRMISVRKPQMKSAGTLQTCPELPLTISDSFHFRLFGHIAAQSRCIYRFEPKCSTSAQVRRLWHRQALVDGFSTSTKRLVLLLDVDKCLSTSASRRQVPVDVDKPSTSACRRRQTVDKCLLTSTPSPVSIFVEKIPLPSPSLSTSTSLSTLPPCGAKSKTLDFFVETLSTSTSRCRRTSTGLWRRHVDVGGLLSRLRRRRSVFDSDLSTSTEIRKRLVDVNRLSTATCRQSAQKKVFLRKNRIKLHIQNMQN